MINSGCTVQNPHKHIELIIIIILVIDFAAKSFSAHVCNCMYVFQKMLLNQKEREIGMAKMEKSSMPRTDPQGLRKRLALAEAATRAARAKEHQLEEVSRPRPTRSNP